jgi:hypothetical protein
MSAQLFKKVDSSDYTTYKKRTTIAKEYVNANTVNMLNPMKMNGKRYNKNFRSVPTLVNTTTDASNCLLQAKSYELKQDYLNGVSYIKVVCE